MSTFYANLADGPTSPAGHAWNELLRAPNRELAFRALEAATLWGVRRGLRNGSLWLPHAEQYGGQHRLLLPAVRWTTARGAFLGRNHLPPKADPFIERVLAQIGSGCESLSAALSAEELMGLDMIDAAILIPGVRLADIRRASRLLEEDRSLRRANDAVVEFMLAHSIAKACWGTESLVRRSGALGTRKDGPGDLGPAGASARLGLERDQGIYWERRHGAPSGSGARHALRRL
jgi:hypothetical protein